jgi:hypothetical protein
MTGNPTDFTTAQPRRWVPDPAAFRRYCAIVGLLFLLVSQFGKLIWYDYTHRVYAFDFPQYYMGGMIARAGAWDSLYPIPIPGIHVNVGYAEGSTLRPRYAQLADQCGVSRDQSRFTQPPPVALLYLPLTLFPLRVSLYFWAMLLTLSCWGISLHVATIYEACRADDDARPSATSANRWLAQRLGGLLILLICFSPMVHRGVRVFNISPIVGYLVGLLVVCLIRRRGPSAPAYFFAALMKVTPTVLGPLFLAMRRWRDIALCIALTIGVLVISVAIMGTGPFVVFWRDVLPSLTKSTIAINNEALYPTLVLLLGRQDLPPLALAALKVVQWSFFVLIMVAIFRKPQRHWEAPPNVAAAALALMSWTLLFSPICWDHYVLLLMPMWGWLAFEALRSRTFCVLAVIAVALCYVPMAGLIGNHYPMGFFPSNICWGILLTLLIAVWALLRNQRRT